MPLNYFEIPQLFKHCKNFNLGSTPSSFKFQSSTSDEMQYDIDTPTHETQKASGYFL